MTDGVTRAEAAALAAAGLVVWCAVGALCLAAHGLLSPGAAWVVFATGLALATGTGIYAARRAERDRAGALTLLGALLLGLVMYAPAFPYGSSDRDPGVYTYDTYAIARTHTLHIPDPLGHLPATSTVHPVLDGQRVPGMHPERAGTALAGFFATYPALDALVYDVAGHGGLGLAGPLLGALALAAFGLAVRRATGVLGGALAVALLGGNMLVVWQAKIPGPEVLAECCIGAGLLAAVAAAATGNRWAATAAGVLTGAVWVVRPDGVIAVVAGVLLAAYVVATRGRNAGAYLLGLAGLVPLAAWQTYGLAAAYSRRNGIPPLAPVAAFAVLVFAVAGLARRVRWRPSERAVHAMRATTTIGAVAFVGVLLLRKALAPDPQPLVPGGRALGWDPYTMYRVAIFITWPGVLLTLGGVAALTRPPLRLARWLLLLPAVLGAVYLVYPHNSPDLMFWGRRFVPEVVPAFAVLGAAGLAALNRGVLRRAVAIGLGAIAVAVPYTQSLPLRSHHEMAGLRAAAQVVAAASGDQQAVYVWVRPGAGCCNEPAYLLAGTVWLRYGKATYTVAPEEAATQAAAAAGLPQHWPVYVVGDGTVPPFDGPLTPVLHHVLYVPVWERGGLRRPDHAQRARVEFTIWRYVPPATA